MCQLKIFYLWAHTRTRTNTHTHAVRLQRSLWFFFSRHIFFCWTIFFPFVNLFCQTSFLLALDQQGIEMSYYGVSQSRTSSYQTPFGGARSLSAPSYERTPLSRAGATPVSTQEVAPLLQQPPPATTTILPVTTRSDFLNFLSFHNNWWKISDKFWTICQNQ